MTRGEIVSAARSWIGTPYLHQASLKGVGCDCLGLLRGVWREVVGPEPETPGPYSADWAEAQAREALAEAALRHFIPVLIGPAKPGDVLLFRWRAGLPAKHVGVLATTDTMIHAHDGAVVTEAALAHWRRRIALIFQFSGVTD